MGRSARNTPRPGPARRQGVLQDKLSHLWHKLAAAKQPPALDRFLARELGRLDGLPRAERLWLGDLLTDAVRFGPLTLFCERLRRDGWTPADEPLATLAAGPGHPIGDELWRRLARLPVPILFFWTFMRKRLAGSELPAIAPPGPGAAEVWKAMRETAPDTADVHLRALWAGLPPAVVPALLARTRLSGWSAADLLRFCDLQASRPPVGLRVLQPAQQAALRSELQAAGFAIEGHSPGLAVRGERGVYELASYRAGVFDIQDRASQAIGDAVAARPGDLIWDCCAGAGGKSLQLAAALQGRGLVIASDLYAQKLEDLRQRASRTGLRDIRCLAWDGCTPPDFGREVADHGGFDRVLVDAPCSGSGTWRRNVDGRLRFAAAPLDELAAVQSGLLAIAATTVRPGGRLVYATCSWLPGENEDVIAAFTRTHPQWRLASQAVHGAPRLDADTTFTAVLAHRD